MKRIPALLLTLGLTASIALISGCGSSATTAQGAPSSTAPNSVAMVGVHNAADVRFSSSMIPHHAQAVQMADEALVKATDAEVRALASQIKAAQDPEIVMMTNWLRQWNQSGATASSGSMSNMGTGTGMMSTTDMNMLGQATGIAFDRLWVQMMIQHHRGAVAMAKDQIAHGQNPDATALARSIVASQSAQIVVLQGVMTRLQG